MNYRFRVTADTVRYSGFFRLVEYRLQHELFAGGWSPEIRRECLERGDAVGVLPYDPQRDEVVLVEQFRIGALRTPQGPWLLEIVAGIFEPLEDKAEVAYRETLEEAGCAILELVPICEYMPTAGGNSETITLYCARVDASGAGGIHGLAEEHEDIHAHVMPRTEAWELLSTGRIVAAAPIIALQWLQLNYQALQAKWQINEPNQ